MTVRHPAAVLQLLTAGEGARGDAGGGWPEQRGRAAGLGPGGEEADGVGRGVLRHESAGGRQ